MPSLPRRVLVSALLSPAVAVALTACTGTVGGVESADSPALAAESAGSGPDRDGRSAGLDVGVTEGSVRVDGLARTWTAYRPTSVTEPGTAPLVVVVHGTGDSAAGIRSAIGPEFERLADAEGFQVLYVDGHRGNWNECRAEGDWPAKQRGLDDVGVVRAAVAATGSAGPVYAVGFSSGGHMVMRLALEAPDLIDAVAPVAANPPVPGNQTCDTGGGPVPVMFVEGREDRINPVDGGEVVVGSGRSAVSRGEVLPAEEGAAWFARHNGLDAAAPAPVRSGDAHVRTWEGADPVRLVVVDGVGHSFPTATGRWGSDPGRYDAPGEIWEFFSGLTD